MAGPQRSGLVNQLSKCDDDSFSDDELLDDDPDVCVNCWRRLFHGKFLEEARQNLRLTWGLILGSLSQVLLNPISTIFAGRLGKTELDAVALANSFINVLGYSVAIGMSAACDTYFSQAIGNKKMKTVGVLLQRALVINLILLVVLCAVYINMEQLLLLLGQHEVVARLAGMYITLFIPGMFCVFLSTILRKYLAVQYVVAPGVVIGLLALVVNALFHYLFLYYMDLGVMGSALAQNVAAFFTSVCFLAYIFITRIYKDTWGGWSWTMLEDWWPFASLGLYGVLMLCFVWWSSEISVILSGILGTTELGAQGVFFNIWAFFIPIGIGPGDATAIRVGQSLGAGKPRHAILVARVGFVLAFSITIGLSLLIFLLRYELPKLVTNVPEIVEETSTLLPFLAYFLLLDNLAFIGRGAGRGAGKQGVSSLIIGVAYYCIGLPVGIPLMFKTPLGNQGIWYGLCLAVTISAVSFLIYINLILDWKKASEKAIERIVGRDLGSFEASSNGELSDYKLYDKLHPHEDTENQVLIDSSTHKADYNTQYSKSSDEGEAKLNKRLLVQRVLTLGLAFIVLLASVECRIFTSPETLVYYADELNANQTTNVSWNMD